MLGDSHVEMGAWYDLFRGHFAIQNAGLSQAKIQDVRRLAETISGIQPKRVVLMCGINDLGTGRAMEVAFRDYAQLLEKIRTNITADRVLVLSIMPVTPQRIADGSTDLNAKVKALNARLHEHCDRVGINYLDVSSAVSDNEGLRQELSWDGLHLNPTGYRKLADRMESFLEEKYDKAESK